MSTARRAAGGRGPAARGSRARRVAAASAVVAALLTGCASPAPAPEVAEAAHLRAWLERTLSERPHPTSQALRVYLAFSDDVDLDLYVTDPLQETVYFANSPSRAGGRLEADLHCGSPGSGDRAEKVRFSEPPPGRYRVSVDHPRSCGRARTAGYALAVEHGGRVELRTGSVRPAEFQLVAFEFDVPAPSAP